VSALRHDRQRPVLAPISGHGIPQSWVGPLSSSTSARKLIVPAALGVPAVDLSGLIGGATSDAISGPALARRRIRGVRAMGAEVPRI
jgi:hypothetical protein